MANNMTKKQRDEIEILVITFMDKLDRSGSNSDYYKELFSSMNDDQFYKFISKQFPFKFQVKATVTEPTMTDAENALKTIGVPMMEKITLPYLYTNKDGVPVSTQKCLVGYVHHKKVQQILTKKSKWSTSISNRDMKTGRLIGDDKGSATSDREFEALAALGLEKTMEEFSKPRADAMMAKNAMYNSISSMGMVNLKDLPDNIDDSLSRNMLNTYLLGAHLDSNLVNKDGYTAYTLKNKQQVGYVR